MFPSSVCHLDLASVCIGVELDRIPCVPDIETKMDNTKNVFTICEFYIKIIIIYANLKLTTTKFELGT